MKPLTRPTLKQLLIVSLCHVSVTNSTLILSREDGIYDHTKTILWVHHRGTILVQQSDSNEHTLKLPLSQAFL